MLLRHTIHIRTLFIGNIWDNMFISVSLKVLYIIWHDYFSEKIASDVNQYVDIDVWSQK